VPKSPIYQIFRVNKHYSVSHLVILIFFLIAACGLSCNPKQSNRLYIPVDQQIAIKKGTRTAIGIPGARYFQNKADYSIRATLDPRTYNLKGQETIHYFNNSPDTLQRLVFNIFQDVYRKGNVRNEPIHPDDVTFGVLVQDLVINGEKVKGNYIDRHFTLMVIDLVKPILPNTSSDISLSWQFRMPMFTKMRMGSYDHSTFFVGYWYPHIAVYDDISGWDKFPYMGIQEFYNDYSNFDVEITVPPDYLVWGTGLLQNGKDLFTEDIYKNIVASQTNDSVTHIVMPENYQKHNILRTHESTKWKFAAENVTDFAFAAGDHCMWDATSVLANDKSTTRTFVNAVYRKESNYKEVAYCARKSISLLSKEIYGLPFPYPQMTVFEGGQDGMEFPMMANDASTPSRKETAELTFHEVAHSYFPFLVGTNEQKYAWMDEGLTEMFTKEISSYFETRDTVQRKPTTKVNNEYYTPFNEVVGKELDVPLMVPSTEMLISYETQIYDKASLAFYYMQEFLGKEKFKSAMQEFIKRWTGKHPTPIDFFATLNTSVGENINWFIRPWFYEICTADLALGKCSVKSNKVSAEIINHGKLPVPIKLNIYFNDGTRDSIYYAVNVWRNGDTTFTVNKKFSKPIIKLILGDDDIPDSNDEDNVFIVK
jgi:hypothetical protein